MKERMVIERPINNINDDEYIHIYHLVQKEDMKYKIEQVPENWDDFLELCKTLKKVFIPANKYYVEFNKLRFYMDGTVEFNGVIIKIVVGVSRMWQIIKNLTGE